jgi:hypothetical protein
MGTTAAAAAEATLESVRCATCNTELRGKYCHDCGERELHAGELSLRHFLAHVLEEFTHLDSKALVTVRYLFTRPGFLTAEFIAGRRSRYMKPLSLFLVASALLLLANSIRPRSPYNVRWLTTSAQATPLKNLLTRLAAKNQVDPETLIERIQERENHLITAAQFFTVVAVALALVLVYRRRYFVEHLVTAFHYFSFTYLCSSVFWPFTSSIALSSSKSTILVLVTTAVYSTYLFLSLRRIYAESAGLALAKTIFVYLGIMVIQIATPTAALLISILTVAK